MNTHIISIGTYANHIVENSMKQILNDSIEYWKIDRDEEGFLNGNLINDCVEACHGSSKVVLLVALGGQTGTHATRLIMDELLRINQPFSFIVILPNLIEGGINVVRAIQSVETLIQKTNRIYIMENCKKSVGTETVQEELKVFENHVARLIKKVIDGQSIFPKDGYKLILNDYRERCQKQIHVLFSLAKIYEEGRDVEQDFVKAFDYYLRATEFGHIGAMYNVGSLYENGEGVTQDFTKAAEYYMQAADKGNSDAACCLARLYEEGLGVSKDEKLAFHWYQKASKNRMPHAIYKIGCMFREGKGVRKDYHEGMKYLRIAALTGYQLAREELKKMRFEFETPKPNKETINQRLGLLVAESGLSSRHYAMKIGYPATKFQDILDGIEETDVPLLRAIRKIYPDVDLNWLVGE